MKERSVEWMAGWDAAMKYRDKEDELHSHLQEWAASQRVYAGYESRAEAASRVVAEEMKKFKETL